MPKHLAGVCQYRRRDNGVGALSCSGPFLLAALAGSFGISWFALSLFQGPTESGLIIMLTVSGFLASLVDSVLGAFLEPRLGNGPYFGTLRVPA
ncbi:MAG: DUF92 domain-containing protein [Spirochaetaceae bacterium]|nr:DUF92 domain-containing protein [Spirochaetaceae bacterium]